MVRRRKGLILGVFSAKGGVGKTTTVANLGAALAQKLKERVIIVETNMTASNLGLHLGILEPPVVIQDVVFGKTSVEDAIEATDYGLHCVPGSVAFTGDLGAVDISGILETLRKKYDVIILDSAPGFGLETTVGMRACDELLIVSQPRIPSIAGTLQTLRTANRLKIPVFGVVLNRVGGKRFEIPTSDIRRTLGWPILATVPEDENVPMAIHAGVPIVIYAPNSPAAVEFRKLAAAVLKHLKVLKRVTPSRKAKRRKARRSGGKK